MISKGSNNTPFILSSVRSFNRLQNHHSARTKHQWPVISVYLPQHQRHCMSHSCFTAVSHCVTFNISYWGFMLIICELCFIRRGCFYIGMYNSYAWNEAYRVVAFFPPVICTIPIVGIMDIAIRLLLPSVSIYMTAWTMRTRINGINFKRHGHCRLLCQSNWKYRYTKYVYI